MVFETELAPGNSRRRRDAYQGSWHLLGSLPKGMIFIAIPDTKKEKYLRENRGARDVQLNNRGIGSHRRDHSEG